jgi:hypothetical protein
VDEFRDEVKERFSGSKHCKGNGNEFGHEHTVSRRKRGILQGPFRSFDTSSKAAGRNSPFPSVVESV